MAAQPFRFVSFKKYIKSRRTRNQFVWLGRNLWLILFPTFIMFKPRNTTLVLFCLLISFSAVGATQVNKCVVNGTTTYQRDPCPTGQVKPAPTAEQLNREQKKRAEAASAARANQTAPAADAATSTSPTVAAIPPSSRTDERKASIEVRVPVTGKFGCDKRKYCSQMTSCAEAKYFLANCPGVKMDGDRDGIPCEEQWCTH